MFFKFFGVSAVLVGKIVKRGISYVCFEPWFARIDGEKGSGVDLQVLGVGLFR